MALAGVNASMPAFDCTGPPGSLKVSMSHGALAVPLVVIHALAAFTRSPAGTTSSTSFMVLARLAEIWSPLSKNCSASAGGRMRATRCVPPVQERRVAAFVEDMRIRRRFTLRRDKLRVGAAHAFQHGQIGAGAERILARGDDHALDRGVGGDLLDNRRKLVFHRWIDDIHRPAR